MSLSLHQRIINSDLSWRSLTQDRIVLSMTSLWHCSHPRHSKSSDWIFYDDHDRPRHEAIIIINIIIIYIAVKWDLFRSRTLQVRSYIPANTIRSTRYKALYVGAGIRRWWSGCWKIVIMMGRRIQAMECWSGLQLGVNCQYAIPDIIL